MTIRTRNRLIVALILAMPFVVLLTVLISDLAAPPPPAAPLPNPNGYADLVQAGAMVSTNSWNYDSDSLEQLRETVAANAEALALARTGLSNECRVPLQFSQAYDETHLNQLADLKKLAFGFAVESRLAELENRANDVVKAGLDTVHLGIVSGRGGILIDELVGIAIEHIGMDRLQKIVGQLDAKSCCETAAELETLDAQRQTWDEVMQQENDWSRRTFTGLRYEIMRLMSHKSLAPAIQRAKQKFQEQQLKTRQLIIDLAVRAYELDKGKPPASASDLVPDYLKDVPQDPFTGTNMVYSPK